MTEPGLTLIRPRSIAETLNAVHHIDARGVDFRIAHPHDQGLPFLVVFPACWDEMPDERKAGRWIVMREAIGDRYPSLEAYAADPKELVPAIDDAERVCREYLESVRPAGCL